MKKLFLLFSIIFMFFSQGCLMVTSSGLAYEDHEDGTGQVATPGKKVDVHYSGWLNKNGEKDKMFDSSRKRGAPFTFTIGAGEVIKGWDEGVAGMKVGGTRTLYIPSHLGYGRRGSGGNVPPRMNLIFDIELLKIH